MNGPPIMAGFLRAEMCTCGADTNDCMIFRCEFAIYIAADAGGIKYGHAYHWLKSGSARIFCFKNNFLLVIYSPLKIRRSPGFELFMSPSSEPCEEAQGGTTIETDTRLRVGRAIAKTEEEVVQELMKQIKNIELLSRERRKIGVLALWIPSSVHGAGRH
jgi:hypothetical protein